MLKSAAFLDRDGVINIDKGYVYKISDFEWVDEAREAIKYLNKENFYVIVISNQSGISRGYYTEKELLILHEFINSELQHFDAYIDDFYYSPYHKDGVYSDKYKYLEHLRKPNVGMLELAQKKWNFSKSNSFLVGDKESDIICAQNFGIAGYKFNGGSLLEFIKKKIEKINTH